MLTKFFVWFIFYSFLGWIYESCFCTITNHQWQNRGFLFGPVVPIYGFGGMFGFFAFHFIPWTFLQEANNWQVFFICAAGSFVMEYVTHYTLEKLFHAYWWDYSNMPLNINGRVCLIFTACFGIAGVLIVRYLIPFVMSWGINNHPLLMEFLALIFMMILGMDIALTVSTLTNFNKNFMRINEEINAQISEAYAALEDNLGDKKAALAESIEDTKEAFADKKEAFTESFVDKKDAIELSLEDKKQAIAEMKENMSKEAITEFMKSLPWVQRRTIMHASGFRSSEHNHEALMAKAAKMLKENRFAVKLKKK